MNDNSVPPFLAHRPAPPLSRYVECLWRAHGIAGHKRERVLPNGVVEVIINLGRFHKVLARDDYSREQLFRESWVAGIQNRHLVIESVCETDLIGIRFRPRIAPHAQQDWSRVAADCGYYDQSHLVHEFRRLSGLAPSEYVATRLPDFNHTVIG